MKYKTFLKVGILLGLLGIGICVFFGLPQFQNEIKEAKARAMERERLLCSPFISDHRPDENFIVVSTDTIEIIGTGLKYVRVGKVGGSQYEIFTVFAPEELKIKKGDTVKLVVLKYLYSDNATRTDHLNPFIIIKQP